LCTGVNNLIYTPIEAKVVGCQSITGGFKYSSTNWKNLALEHVQCKPFFYGKANGK
jgi:hypothetical protein